MVYCTSCGNEALGDAAFCSKCGKPLQPISSTEITRKRSKRWYLLPILFDIIGGVICYYALQNDDKKLAQNCLKLGVILFLVNITIWITIVVYDEFEHENNPTLQNHPYSRCPDCGNQVTIASGAGAAATADCVIAKNCFSPNPLSVTPGTTVTWKNTDTVSHYVTSGQPSDNTTGTVFDSGNLIKPGGTYQFTFANAGTFDYFCTVHPWMTGKVIVE